MKYFIANVINMDKIRKMDIKIDKNIINENCKIKEKLYFEKHMTGRRWMNDGIKSKNINQDYYDCIYSGCYKEYKYVYGLNW